jgi:hypothetical protein
MSYVELYLSLVLKNLLQPRNRCKFQNHFHGGISLSSVVLFIKEHPDMISRIVIRSSMRFKS